MAQQAGRPSQPDKSHAGQRARWLPSSDFTYLSPPCARREGRAGRAADVPAAAGRQAGGREQRDLPGEPDQGREG